MRCNRKSRPHTPTYGTARPNVKGSGGFRIRDGLGQANPRFSVQGEFVESIWQDFVAKQAARLLIQGPLADVIPGLRYNPLTGHLHGQADMPAAVHRLFEEGPATVSGGAAPEEWRGTLSHWK